MYNKRLNIRIINDFSVITFERGNFEKKSASIKLINYWNLEENDVAQIKIIGDITENSLYGIIATIGFFIFTKSMGVFWDALENV